MRLCGWESAGGRKGGRVSGTAAGHRPHAAAHNITHYTHPSTRAGLYLPTSDVDAVIMGSGCADIPQGLKALATALARRNMAKNMQVGRLGGGEARG